MEFYMALEGPSVSHQVLYPTSVTLKKVIPWFVPRHLKCVVNNANVGDEINIAEWTIKALSVGANGVGKGGQEKLDHSTDLV